MDYYKLMQHDPKELGKMTNVLNQEITFYEHPLREDTENVICVCHKLKLAETSGFFDMKELELHRVKYKNHEPRFINGEYMEL